VTSRESRMLLKTIKDAVQPMMQPRHRTAATEVHDHNCC
jgi:hypothetical protein